MILLRLQEDNTFHSIVAIGKSIADLRESSDSSVRIKGQFISRGFGSKGDIVKKFALDGDFGLSDGLAEGVHAGVRIEYWFCFPFIITFFGWTILCITTKNCGGKCYDFFTRAYAV